ncbi:hypothetical protein CJ030_MR0G004711 [Morella rubra]|uniref:Uncharacterized protein n=1 Tax=Morella rubra TaxID=262757 RepID=A0A6A1UL95_9ROSI|nr:hypothetical protein CJ030_MR0G004711 [Morella rubra]
MADFTPNLDDGEVWLPSDIFHNEVVPASSLRNRNYSCMDDMTERFAAFTLLQHRRNVSKPPPNLLPNLERFRPAVRKYGSVSRVPQQHLSLNGGLENNAPDIYGYGTGPYFPGNKLLYEYQPLEPPQPQVNGEKQNPDRVLLDSLRTRVLQTRQNRLQNRLLPLQGSGGFGLSTGGFVKESGGTGVFIPRILSTTTTTSGTTPSTTTADIRKKRGESAAALQNSCSFFFLGSIFSVLTRLTWGCLYLAL